MATANISVTGPGTIVGWDGGTVTQANYESSNDVRVTGGRPGHYFEANFAAPPADFGSANTIVLAVEWRLDSTATRPKYLHYRLLDGEGGAMLVEWTGASRTNTTEATDTSPALDVTSFTKADLQVLVIEISVGEEAGTADLAEVEIDYIVPLVLDYDEVRRGQFGWLELEAEASGGTTESISGEADGTSLDSGTISGIGNQAISGTADGTSSDVVSEITLNIVGDNIAAGTSFDEATVGSNFTENISGAATGTSSDTGGLVGDAELVGASAGTSFDRLQLGNGGGGGPEDSPRVIRGRRVGWWGRT